MTSNKIEKLLTEFIQISGVLSRIQLIFTLLHPEDKIIAFQCRLFLDRKGIVASLSPLRGLSSDSGGGEDARLDEFVRLGTKKLPFAGPFTNGVRPNASSIPG